MGSGALLAPALSWHCQASSASLLTQDAPGLSLYTTENRCLPPTPSVKLEKVGSFLDHFAVD